MIELPSTALGDHALPPLIHGPAAPPAPPRRRRRGLRLGIIGAIAAVGALGFAQLGASVGYDTAEREFAAAAQSTARAQSEVEQVTADLSATTGFATQLLEADAGMLVDAPSKEPLSAAVAEAEQLGSAAAELLEEKIPATGEKPVLFWDLFPAAARLDDQRTEILDLEEEMGSRSPALEAANDSVTEQGITLLAAASESAGGFEAAHIAARNDDVIALRDAASTASSVTALDQRAVDAFIGLQDAAAQVVASEQAELAEKAGPLQQVRLEIEAFARSLAPGVLLEFDWNAIVNGAGGRGSMGGLTTWWWDEPDRALIELSNSVAEQWPSIRSKSLVAHEVGHAISVKCEDLYDSSTQDSIEQWATAWAISMGFTDDANGVWAYGYPPQSYIDAAHGCR